MAIVDLLARLSGFAVCQLSTSGRRTLRSHDVDLWFVVGTSVVYVVSGRGTRADWVRNMTASPAVTLRIADQSFSATGRPVTDDAELDVVRGLYRRKYQARYAGDLSGGPAQARAFALERIEARGSASVAI